MKIEAEDEDNATCHIIEIGSKGHHEFCEFLINN